MCLICPHLSEEQISFEPATLPVLKETEGIFPLNSGYFWKFIYISLHPRLSDGFFKILRLYDSFGFFSYFKEEQWPTDTF